MDYFDKAMELWGPGPQTIKLIEEMGEAIQALSKYWIARWGEDLGRELPKGDDEEELAQKVIKEVCDVRILMDQLEQNIIKEPLRWRITRQLINKNFRKLVEEDMRARN